MRRLRSFFADDKRKQDYYRKFAGGDWSDATNYDLCLNAGKLGFEKCVDAILAQMKLWELNDEKGSLSLETALFGLRL